jgi:hypothetical protein
MLSSSGMIRAPFCSAPSSPRLLCALRYSRLLRFSPEQRGRKQKLGTSVPVPERPQAQCVVEKAAADSLLLPPPSFFWWWAESVDFLIFLDILFSHYETIYRNQMSALRSRRLG